ncbi:MAG: hypothetical protein AAFX93_08910 [Verrucomicrobiota bacterium]
MKKLLLLAAACMAMPAAFAAQTVNLDNYWNGQASTLRSSLLNACNAAGNGGRINLSARAYVSNQELVVNRSVRIVGAGRWSSEFRRTDGGWGPVIRITVDNVELNSLLINGNVATPQSGNADRFGVIFNGKSNTKLIGSTVFRVNYGVHNGGGKASNGLVIDNTHFVGNHAYGLWLWSSNANPSPLWVGRFEFKNSYIAKDGFMGVNVDYGNEDRSKLTTIDMSANNQSSLVADNYIAKVREFGIAIARAKNIDVLRNTVEGGGGLYRSNYGAQLNGTYSQALHIEDRTANIYAAGGTLMNYNNTTLNGNNFNSIIAITAPESQFPEQLVRNCTIENITLKGNTKWGAEVVKCNSITMRNLDFSQVTASGPKVNSWTLGQNILLTGNTGLARSEVSQGSGGFFSLPGGGWLNSSSTF